jgi:hypothetical protein
MGNNIITYAVTDRVAALALVGVLVLTVTLAIPLQQQQAYAAAKESTRVEQIPIDETVFVSCAADGSGEEVHLTGEIHTVIRFVTNSTTGGIHIKFHANDQGISGIGLTTGDRYHRTGATNSEHNAKVGEEITVVDSFNIIGQGNGNNFLAHVTIHMTVNANGDVTAEVVKFSIECK